MAGQPTSPSEVSVPQLAAALADAIRENDNASLETLLSALSVRVGEEAASSAGRITSLRSRIDRLSRRLERPFEEESAGPEATQVAQVQQRLTDFIDTLTAAYRTAQVNEVAVEALEEVKTLKDHILRHLRTQGPSRPVHLAQLCRVDVTQISRALRQLQAEDRVTLVPPPHGAGDGRARWWQLAPPATVETTSLSREPLEDLQAFGSHHSLQVELGWRPPSSAHPTLQDVTHGRLRLLLEGTPVWRGQQPQEGIVRSWLHLLTFLSNAWPHLQLEQGFPFNAHPGPIQAVESQLGQRWDQTSSPRIQEEQLAFSHFNDRHNLATPYPNIPPLWIIREGNLSWIASETKLVRAAHEEIRDTLVQLGDAIANRLSLAPEDADPATLIKAWQNRGAIATSDKLRIATGLAPADLASLEAHTEPQDFWETGEDPLELNELIAVARMASTLPLGEVATILEEVRKAPLIETPALDELSDSAQLLLEDTITSPPYEQGHVVAEWLRSQIRTGETARVDPISLLGDWGIEVREVEINSTQVDAFACWGERHGPAIILNPRGKHNRSKGGRSATLAHEIGHLLMDRSDALPLVEVIGGRTSPLVEARARAFSAELLLPRRIAGAKMAHERNPESSLKSLQSTFGVSQELVAWQARNSGVRLSSSIESFLRGKVSAPESF